MCHTAVASLANLYATMTGVVMVVAAFVMLCALVAAVVLDSHPTTHRGNINCQQQGDNM